MSWILSYLFLFDSNTKIEHILIQKHTKDMRLFNSFTCSFKNKEKLINFYNCNINFKHLIASNYRKDRSLYKSFDNNLKFKYPYIL